MKIYLLGPTKGLPNLNRRIFDETAIALRERGLSIVNLHEEYEAVDVTTMSKREFLKVRLDELLKCDSFVVLQLPAAADDAEFELLTCSHLELHKLDLQDLLKMPVTNINTEYHVAN